jgi:hypothetical protein
MTGGIVCPIFPAFLTAISANDFKPVIPISAIIYGEPEIRFLEIISTLLRNPGY